MTDRTITVRPAGPGDEAGVRALVAGADDGGRVGFRPRHHVSRAEASRTELHEGSDLVAIGDGRVVGAGSVRFSRVGAGEHTIPLAWLAGLAVDPAWRRRGVGSAVSAALFEQAAAWDEPCAVAAAIQIGNTASMGNAARWFSRVAGTVRVTPVPPPRRRPKPALGITIRPATQDDLPVVADGLRAMSHTLLLAPAPSADELADWLAVRLRDATVHEYVVATDADGRVVAGLGLEDEGAQVSLEVTRMPAAIAAANLVLRVVPKDRLMRNLNLRYAWFRPGHDDAARALWRQVRWDYRDRGTSIVRSVDPTGPLADVLPVARWLPATSLQIVVQDPPGHTLPALPVGPHV